MDILAVASVAAGGASFVYNKGCAGVNNAGVGLNDLILDNPADAAECVVQGTVLGGTAASLSITHISDTVKRVSTFIDDPITGVPAPSDLVGFTFTLVR